MMKREVAWRVFAAEYNSSSMEMKGEEERAPSYIITPLGAMINRLFVIGVMTDVENMGTTEEPMWRGRISDPTGTFYVSAGQYQPEAALAMSKIKPPAFIAVIGKSRTYSPEEGTIYVSIRPERIAAVDERMRDHLVLETCKLTLERISALEDALEMETPSAEEMVKLGHGKSLAEGVVKSLPHYQGLELDRYRTMVVDALRYLIPEYRIEAEVPQSVAEVPEEIEEEEKEDIDKEEKVLGIIDKLDKKGKGAPWDEIVEETGKSGIDKSELEELTNSLLDKGLIYEPVLGKMKRI
ncbi:MAG: glycerol dehydrogenase [Methanomassiliicoccales archaeon]|nr:glycerol dehydrogenase [Methanomassiliicoccales archaeon]